MCKKKIGNGAVPYKCKIIPCAFSGCTHYIYVLKRPEMYIKQYNNMYLTYLDLNQIIEIVTERKKLYSISIIICQFSKRQSFKTAYFKQLSSSVYLPQVSIAGT